MTRYQLPDIADLIRLGDQHERAITVYAETSPAPNERENSLLQVKSAVDRALRTIREGGARHAAEEKLRSRWAEIRRLGSVAQIVAVVGGLHRRRLP